MPFTSSATTIKPTSAARKLYARASRSEGGTATPHEEVFIFASPWAQVPLVYSPWRQIQIDGGVAQRRRHAHGYVAQLTASDATAEVVLDLKGKILKEEKQE
jgi:hypothetical protein